jgi:import inner membrane translocase subunit TIM9
MQDFMRLYSGLVEKCFNACANDFTSKALTTNEVSSCLESGLEFGLGEEGLIRQSTCVVNCTDKFLKHSERVGARFAEHNAGESGELLRRVMNHS